MNFLANLGLRRKLLVGRAPLVLMVIIAGLYSSIQSKRIDTWYSELIDKDIKSLQVLTSAQGIVSRFRAFLYDHIAEPDPNRMRVIEAEMDVEDANDQALIGDSLRQTPGRTKEIKAAAELFNLAASHARPVLHASLAGDKVKSMNLMRDGVDPELTRAREALGEIVDALHKSVDEQSAELTSKTRVAILITWLVIALGLATSWAFTSHLVQKEVIRELWTVRDSIRDLAAGQLNKPIPYFDRTNEIGEISRALQTLQVGATERETQVWVKAETAAAGLRLQSAQDFATFAAGLFSRMSETMPLLCGVFYLADESHTRLIRVGSYALGETQGVREFALGQGLVGQTALERRTLVISTNQSLNIHVSAGMGTVVPRSLLYVPLVDRDIVVGVLELALLSPLSVRQQTLLDALLPSVAMNAEILSVNIKTRKLLERTE
jgi:two-component system sensor histidine kinase/response regulator